MLIPVSATVFFSFPREIRTSSQGDLKQLKRNQSRLTCGALKIVKLKIYNKKI
jgi:hypothetical protein